MYSGAYTRLLTDESLSDLIAVKISVKQRKPASGIIFNLYTNLIVQRLQVDAAEYQIVAIADDYLLLSTNAIHLQTQAGLLCELSTCLGLQLNPKKNAFRFICHMLGGRTYTASTPISVYGGIVPAVKDFKTAPFQGL